jgi:hypothetical protein
MTNILQLSIETAKRDLMTPKSLLYCCYCSKPRIKGDYNSRSYCSYECHKIWKWNYCVICGKKINKLFNNYYARCSQECFDKDVTDLWKKLND